MNTIVLLSFFGGLIGSGILLMIFWRLQKNSVQLTAGQTAAEMQAQSQAQTQAQLQMQAQLNQQLSEQLSQQMSLRFEAMANKFFEEKSVKITDQNVKSLSTMLEPFKERLKDFEKVFGRAITEDEGPRRGID